MTTDSIQPYTIEMPEFLQPEPESTPKGFVIDHGRIAAANLIKKGGTKAALEKLKVAEVDEFDPMIAVHVVEKNLRGDIDCQILALCRWLIENPAPIAPHTHTSKDLRSALYQRTLELLVSVKIARDITISVKNESLQINAYTQKINEEILERNSTLLKFDDALVTIDKSLVIVAEKESTRLSGIRNVNQNKEAAKERARALAQQFWNDNPEKKTRIGEMAEKVFAELEKEGYSDLPINLPAQKMWIAEDAPAYARAKGRAKK